MNSEEIKNNVFENEEAVELNNNPKINSTSAVVKLEEEAKFHKVIKMIFNLLELSGFYLDGRITIVSKKTGQIWK